MSSVNLEEFFWVKKGVNGGEDELAYSVVVLVGQPLDLVSKVDDYCHSHGIKFVLIVVVL